MLHLFSLLWHDVEKNMKYEINPLRLYINTRMAQKFVPAVHHILNSHKKRNNDHVCSHWYIFLSSHIWRFFYWSVPSVVQRSVNSLAQDITFPLKYLQDWCCDISCTGKVTSTKWLSQCCVITVQHSLMSHHAGTEEEQCPLYPKILSIKTFSEIAGTVFPIQHSAWTLCLVISTSGSLRKHAEGNNFWHDKMKPKVHV